MADSILFDLAGTLVTKLGSYALQELGLLLGVNGELEKLKNTVSAIGAVLLDAEEQPSKSHALKDWLSKLKDVFYEIDDLIDEFNYEALRRQVLTRHRRKTKQVRIFFSKSNQIAFSYKMGGKIKEIGERLKVINDDTTQFHLSERVMNKPTVDVLRNIRDPGDYIPEEEVIGRNHDKKEIIDLLLNSNAREDIALVAMVGMGGLGKTTIAQSVYNDNMITKHFELKLWVCISEEFEVKVIIQNIIEYAGKKPDSLLQMALLQSELRKLVDGKKYLLVMDDVWNEDHEKWNSLKILLIGGAKGSKILITTRSNQVANTFDPTSVYSLEELDDENSWLLFKKMALGDERAEKDPENLNLVEIGKEIVTRLKGVPLAIRTIGRLLYLKKSKDFWSSFKDKELYQIMEGERGLEYMLSILKLSYNHLPSNLKQCFQYCALFPKDFEIRKDEVIMQWVAQGFIQPNDIGKDYFMELLSRSFFQDVTKDVSGDIFSCKMHDLMHDLACSIVENECARDVNARVLNKRTHHVSFDLMSWEELEKLPEKLSKAKNLRTCFLQYSQENFVEDNNFNEIFERVFYNLLRLRTLDLQLSTDDEQNVKFLKYISKLKHLRYLKIKMDKDIQFFSNSITELYNLEVLILECDGLKELPRGIENLINLTHLDLSRSDVKLLPDSITQLKKLETLLLGMCINLKELPRDTKNLINLKHLNLGGCWALTCMPKGLGGLTNLQTLNLFVLGMDNNGGGLSELNELNQLRGWLTIKGLEFCTTSDLPTNAKFLQLKSSLKMLILEWGWDDDSCNELTIDALDDDYERSLECLQPHPNLRGICIDGYKGVKLCSWVSCHFLGCLGTIELSRCKRLQHLPQFDQFPNLKSLYLGELPGIEYIFNHDYPCSSTLFPSLEELSIFQMPNLKRWWKKGQTSTKSAQNSVLFPIIFPCLSKLEIWDCPLLASITCHAPARSLEINDSIEYHFDPNDSDVVSRKCLQSLSYLGLTHIYESGFLFSWLQHVTTLQELYCSNLMSLPESIGNLTSLLTLRISHCLHLTSLPESIGNLTSLLTLRIGHCLHLTSLPESIGNLTSLLTLRIGHCLYLTSLPESIGNLTSLLTLRISHCLHLKSLPESIGNLTSLSRLEITNCTDLTSLPESIGNLTSLTELTIEYCPSLTSLPEGIRQLHCLQSLTTENCPLLKERCKKETGEDWLKIAHIRKVNHWG